MRVDVRRGLGDGESHRKRKTLRPSDMPLRRITTTSLSTLRPLGRAADRDYQKIVAYLSSHPALGPDCARIFSEPVRVRGGDEIDWYWGEEASPFAPQPLLTMGEERRQGVLDRVRTLLAAVRSEGERLQRKGDSMAAPLLLAASLPEPLPEFIWWVPKSDSAGEGFPIVVGWGFTLDVPRTAQGVLEGVRSVKPASPPDTAGAGTGNGVASAAAARRSTTPGMLVGLLWLLFSVLAVTIGVLLLRACGINGTGWGVSGGFGFSFCAKPVAEAVPAPDRARALSALVQDLELSLARKEAACIAQLPPPAPPVQPSVTQLQPPPAPTPAQPARPPADDRLKLPQTPGRDLSFLRGCWQSDPFKHSPDKPAPGVSTYCFDASGRGTLVFRRGANHECRLSARARLEGGKLFLDDQDGKCNDGTDWYADHLVCEPDRGGIAVCSGTSVRARWSVNLHKR